MAPPSVSDDVPMGLASDSEPITPSPMLSVPCVAGVLPPATVTPPLVSDPTVTYGVKDVIAVPNVPPPLTFTTVPSSDTLVTMLPPLMVAVVPIAGMGLTVLLKTRLPPLTTKDLLLDVPLNWSVPLLTVVAPV